MNTIGSQEWIDNVVKAARDNRANQLNPNNGLCCRNTVPETVSSQSQSAALVAAGVAIGAAIVGSVWGIASFLKRKAAEENELIVESVADDQQDAAGEEEVE